MAIPAKHKERVAKFVQIVVNKVVSEETERVFFKKGALDNNYTISLYSTGLLPMYNDDRIEIRAEVNDKKTECFFISAKSLADKTLDPTLVKDLVEAIMKLRIKEIK